MKRFVCIAALAATAALAACSSSTGIRVSDTDARVYVNGEYLGTGNVRYMDRKLAFSRQEVTLRKDGCEPQTYILRRNEKPHYGAILGAYLFAVPILWTAQYKEKHAYEFVCEQQVASNG